MTCPLVSIVLPTYNRATVVRRSIDSLLAQTFKDFEIIVVDDGSTDSTVSELADLHNQSLRIIHLDTNSGPSKARNIGIANARGKYIAFQDSDDVWHPQKLEVQITALENLGPSGYGACYSRYILRQRSRETTIPSFSDNDLEGDIYCRLLKDNVVGTPTLIVMRDILGALGGFDETLNSLEDWDLALRIASKCKFAFVNAPLVTAYHSPGSVGERAAGEDIYKIAVKHLDSYEHNNLQSSGADVFYNAGHSLVKNGEAGLGRTAMKISLNMQFNPRHAGAYFISYLGTCVYRILSRLF